MTYVTKHIDWLSCTFVENIKASTILPSAQWHYLGRGNHGYKARYVDRETGALLETEAPDMAMGHHLDMSGRAIALSAYERPDGYQNLVDYLHDLGGKASRMDLAINIHAGTLTPQRLRSDLEAGKATAKARSWRMVEGKQGDIAGSTLYIGSPHSDVQLRCYDKGAEQGIVNGEAWIRLELELRRLRAKNAMLSCHYNGIAETVTGHVSDFLSDDHPDIKLAYSGASSPPVALEPRQSNRARWLMGQVVQALAKEATLNPQFIEAFNRALAAELARLTILGKDGKLG